MKNKNNMENKNNIIDKNNIKDKTELNFSIIAKQYSSEEEAYKFLESIRWENGLFAHIAKIKEQII